ncbi:class I SAM-dependent methyltransferase [Streptomyces sp. NPDC001450]
MDSPAQTGLEQRIAEMYDAMHEARASTTITAHLYAQAMGDAYPHEIEPAGSCDWPLLGTIVSALRLQPGQQLVDLGCGTGGVGLWLARALAARLTGIDISPSAVSLATDRVTQFAVPAERATFRVGSLAETGLPDCYAHGLICVDALGFERDREKALREIRRVLLPGARAAVTSGRSRTQPALPPWSEQAAAAGLILEAEHERPDEPRMWQRLYELWIAHETQLRKQLGDDQADSMLTEARTRAPMLEDRSALVVTLRRPED